MGKRDRDDDGPLSAANARSMMLACVRSTQVRFTVHAREEMEADGITDLEIYGILRSGVIEPAEWESGAWRYRTSIVQAKGRLLVTTYAVVEFEQQADGRWTVVVTAWRKKRR